ncbi:deoxyribose-phosphate aldolase [Porphyromonas crevioricanis]|uniref:Deoxyribose-phosphate aldolase n=1 Tax=Porphyromonas crevioricanis TaxID=393921 RepID=A0AB34PJB7_9PORP|nr:deoxyribose-phosphate aldolase [Porphyromonas crevioricanis]KGN96364.1 deoxyribose-phosphate aldolase [Porphyromonas crevioricanis]
MSKYDEAFAKFESMTDEAVKTAVDKIVSENYDKYNTKEVMKFLIGTIDLTSLNGADTEEHIARFVQPVNDKDGQDPTIPSVAAICVYPNFVKTVRETLTAGGVRVACVSGCFPASQSFIEVKLAETSLAVRDGADEVDIVLNMGAFLSDDYETAANEIEEQKTACRNAHLKVILETGALKTAELIRKASILSLFSGADFIKTSTGKEYPGASLEAAYVMCSVLKQYYQLYGKRCGVKFSGGIRSAEEAVKYYAIVREVLGEEWLIPELMRIGASSLLGNLEKAIAG